MLETLERPDIDTDIEFSLVLDEVIKCESQHKHSPGLCSVKAEYILVYSCNHNSSLWCVARYHEFLQTLMDRTCFYCKRILAECWKVRPL